MANNWMNHYWHPVGTAEEVGEQPKQFFLLGRRLVIYRNGTQLVALDDTCAHRGAALSNGRVAGGVISCPYHGWQYDAAGQCVHIPSLPDGAPAVSSRIRVNSYQVREEYGLVWVAMTDQASIFPSWPENAWANSDYRVFMVGTYRWKASAARTVENAMDFSHFDFVHKGYTNLGDGPVIKPYEVSVEDYGLRYVYNDTVLLRDYQLYFPYVLHDKKTVISASDGGTWSEKTATQEGDTTILTFIAAPISDSDTIIYSFIARNHSINIPDEQMSSGFDEIMEQDRVIVESQWPVEIPDSIQDENHQRCPDAASLAYRRLLSEARQA